MTYFTEMTPRSLLSPALLSMACVLSGPVHAEQTLRNFISEEDAIPSDSQIIEADADGDGWSEAIVKTSDCDVNGRCPWFLVDRDSAGRWEIIFEGYGANPYFFQSDAGVSIAADGLTWGPGEDRLEPIGSELGRISPRPGNASEAQLVQFLTGLTQISPHDLSVYDIDLLSDHGAERVILRSSAESAKTSGYEVSIFTAANRKVFHDFIPGPTKVYRTDVGAFIYNPNSDQPLQFLE